MTKISYEKESFKFLEVSDKLKEIAQKIVTVETEKYTYMVYILKNGSIARETHDNYLIKPVLLEVENLAEVHRQYKEKHI